TRMEFDSAWLQRRGTCHPTPGSPPLSTTSGDALDEGALGAGAGADAWGGAVSRRHTQSANPRIAIRARVTMRRRVMRVSPRDDARALFEPALRGGVEQVERLEIEPQRNRGAEARGVTRFGLGRQQIVADASVEHRL